MEDFKLTWRYLRSYRNQLTIALFFAAIARISSLFSFQIFRLLVDRYITKTNYLIRSDFLIGVFYLLLILGVIAIVSRLAENWKLYFTGLAIEKISSNIFLNGVSHAFSIPYRDLENCQSGEIMQKLQHAKDVVQVFIFNFINIFFPAILGIIFVLLFSFWVNVWIGLVFFVMSISLITTFFILSYKPKLIYIDIVKKAAKLSSSLTETLRNIEIVKGMGLEKQETSRINLVNSQLLSLNIKKIELAQKLEFIQGLLVNFCKLIILVIMLLLIYNGTITLGEFLSLFFYISFIFSPLLELVVVTSQYQETVVGLRHLESLLNIPILEVEKNNIRLEKINSISFKNISFRYANEEENLINISFSAYAGETIAFVGPSGCGKTTLIKILIGLYQPEKGNLFFNEKDSKKIDFNYLRQKIGLVSQETQLFAGTIRENLLFANPAATENECFEALKNTFLLNVVGRGDLGLDTLIGEGGIKLSGGERQRLAIARALLRKPDLIIFDEATSNLDTMTEKEIIQTIRQIEKQSAEMINIIVSHRLSTVAHAKKIFVMSDGKIVATGGHEDLKQNCPLYASLWHEQTKDYLAVNC